MKKQFLLISLLFSTILFAQKKYEPTWSSLNSRPIPEWFTDAKFGIFIHWGLYSVPAWGPVGKEWPVYSKYAEWYWHRMQSDKTKVGDAFRAFHNKTYGQDFHYPDFVKDFKAELYNPAQWADLFAQAGAKYVVLTSKHHEGFTLWPSAQAWNWNAVDVGPHRDLAGDLSKAVKDKGLKMGFYYSLYEWYNPLYHSNVAKYVDDHMLPQLKDLVTSYKPDIVWTDGEWDHSSEVWKSPEFLSWLYNESGVKQSVVVNDRWGKETRGKHGGFYTTEYDLIHDQNSSELKIAHPWEECRGIGGSFGYNRNENLEHYESSASLVHMLIEKVARGGNLLLDIGPAADGTIPVIMQQRLLDMGAWLKVNGEAIYGTKEWDKAPAVKKGSTRFFTRKGSDLYVLCTSFPTEPITIENVRKPKAVTMLGTKTNIQSNVASGRVVISPPAARPAVESGQFAWVFKLENVL